MTWINKVYYRSNLMTVNELLRGLFLGGALNMWQCYIRSMHRQHTGR